MTFAGLEIPPVVLLACISGIVWAIRLEGKFKIQERDHQELKEKVKAVETVGLKFSEDILATLKDVQKSINGMGIEIVKVMGEIKHANTKITRLEAGKMRPILEKYFDEEGNPKD